MNSEAYFPESQAKLTFTLAGYPGSIAVYYGANADPAKAGFDALPGLNIPLDMCLGYPVMHARIESYNGSGYRMLCGWIQIITRESLAAAGQAREDAHRSCSVDLFPAMEDAGSPFATYGFLPSCFDAPCQNLGNNLELTWAADTFLTTVPLRSRQEEISWLAGFRWGYREYAASVGKPVELLPLEVTDQHVWNRHLPFLRNAFDSWRFQEG
jgi:hypothetical protein